MSADAAKTKKKSSSRAEVYKKLPKQGKKISLGKGEYFVYRLVKNATKRTSAVKLEIYDKNNNRIKKLKIIGKLKPLMKGKRSALKQKRFKMNGRKEYVMSVKRLVKGKWELKIDIYVKNKIVYRGKLKIKV